jgi:hypothetical protein
MNIRAGVALALLLCASCKKSDYFDKASEGSGSATAKTEEAKPDDKTGSATTEGSAAPQVSYDPWSGGPPPGSDTGLGAKCGPKLNKIDPWDQAPKPKDDTKVDVAQIEPAKKDKVEIKDFGGVSTTSGFKVTYNPSRIKNHEYRTLFAENRMFDSSPRA